MFIIHQIKQLNFCLFALVLSVCLLSLPVSAQYSTTGSGTYKNNIYWLSWGATSGLDVPTGTSKSHTITSGTSTFTTTCTASNYSTHATFLTYQSGIWGGDALDDLYGIGVPNGLSVPDGTSPSFRLTCNSTLNGSAFALRGLVYSEAEQSGNNEWTEATPVNGGTWRIIDRYRSDCNPTTTSMTGTLTGSTLRLAGINGCSQGPIAVAFLDGGNAANITVKGGGVSAVGVGFILNTDWGDAPASYGTAVHVIQPSWNGGTVSGSQQVNESTFSLATLNQPTLRLGATVDYETSNQANLTATGDDSTTAPGTDDENGVTIPASAQQGATITVPVAVNGSGQLNAWFDWNNDGDFLDAGEQVATNRTVSTGTTNLSVSIPGNATVGAKYARFRICSTSTVCDTPAIIAGDGEVEDYRTLSVTSSPALTITKSSNGSWTVGQTGAQYTLTATNSGASATSGTVTVLDVLPTGIAPNWTNTLSSNGFSCTFSGQTVTCTRATAIAAGSSVNIVLPVDVTASTPLGTNSITNYASIGGGGSAIATAPIPGASCTPTSNCTSNQTTVIGPADLSVDKSHTGSFTRGSTGIYSLKVNNSGQSATVGQITVTDTLPLGMTVNGGAVGSVTAGGINGANWSCSSNAVSPQVITCTSSNVIAATGSSDFTLTVNVASGIAVSVTNTATVSGGGETNTTNNSDSDPTNITQQNFGVCDARMWLTSSPTTNTGTSLQLINVSSNPFTYPTIGQGSAYYNAAGYNPLDNYIYAIRLQPGNSGNSLYRIGADGSTVDLGVITGLPVANYLSGTFGSDGTYYVTDNIQATLYKINVTTLTATSVTMTSQVGSGDFAWVNGMIYGILSDGRVRSLNTTSGVVTNVGSPNGALSPVGAVFGAPNGLFGALNDGSGFYQFDLVTGAHTLISGAPSANLNDGANCPNANITFPSDLAITKTDNTSTYSAGSNVVYTITVTNSGPFGSQAATVTDSLPSGITTASWTCSATGGGNCKATGTGAINDSTVDLPIGAVATYTLTMSVPANFTGNLVNTASVAVSSSNTDSTPGNNSATDTDTIGAPNVGLVKACPLPADCTSQPQSPGTDLTYQIAFTNTGGGGAANLAIVDAIPVNTDFKIGSATITAASTGLTFVIEYSNNYDASNASAATWTYTPVSAGGGASAGYDRNVKAVRWRVTAGSLSNVSPNNTGSVGFITKIR